MTKVRFERVSGGYRFEVDGRLYLAAKNEAGFAHRNWDLWDIGAVRIMADQLPTRQACVERVMEANKQALAVKRWLDENPLP